MNYYAVQVKTRGEKKYIRLFRAVNPDCPVAIYFPTRKLSVRRRGAMVQTTPAVFPGYIFLETDGHETLRRWHWRFRRTDGFFRFLKSNRDIRPLEGRDLETALHFIKKTGPLAQAGISRVYFDEEARIVVVDGPLAGLEGNIVKVDKRKGRAKIKLDLYGDSFTIDLGFEMMGKAASPRLKF
ncbi:MAG: antiterminator LoaP [Treponema sp.]|jgi:transcriptional antiterminator NusG|nr:antiterminator LoaP [Treponema sp.]